MREIVTAAREWARSGQPVALARVVAARGSAPRSVGSALALSGDRRLSGSVSGGCVEGAVIQATEGVLAGGPAVTLSFSGNADPLTEIALGCGGEVTIFVERADRDGDLAPIWSGLLASLDAGDECALITDLTPTPSHWLYDASGALLCSDSDRQPAADAFRQAFLAPLGLIIVGADAVGQAVADFAAMLGWRVTMIDPRAAWLNALRFPRVERVVRWPDEALQARMLDARTAVVVLSHDPKIDEPALLVALRSGAGYVGALGSRTAHATRRARLLASGLTPDEIARLRAPVGLDLGGNTSHEMALSIVAEIVASRHGHAGGALSASVGPIHDASLPLCEDDGGSVP